MVIHYSSRYVVFLMIFFCSIVLLFSCSTDASSTIVREAAVAGAFYPENPVKLTKMINSFLEAVPGEESTEKVVAAIAPHAGYVYSGQVAAYTYKRISQQEFDTVILIGPCHRAYDVHLSGISVYKEGFYKTPLGYVEIDRELSSALLSMGEPFTFNREAHAKEHCLEVQLPFLQTIRRGCKIVPILMGYGNDLDRTLANALTRIVDRRHTLVIISTDMSHYPAYEEARAIDIKSLEYIKSCDSKGLKEYNRSVLSRKIDNMHCTFCGLQAVSTAILYAGSCCKITSATLLKYANSGDVRGGDKTRVVGYAALTFALKKGEEIPQSDISKLEKTDSGESVKDLTEEQCHYLLELSRKTLVRCTQDKTLPKPEKESLPFTEERGVFVTLHKEGQLRGCIGHIYPHESLEQSVITNTVNAALRDPRFPAVKEAEVNQLSIEISVLTVPRKIASINDFVLGKHGIILKKGYHQAVFLPQVAPEQKWDKATTLTYLSRKAGLDDDAWHQGTDFYVFEAHVFHEAERTQ